MRDERRCHREGAMVEHGQRAQQFLLVATLILGLGADCLARNAPVVPPGWTVHYYQDRPYVSQPWCCEEGSTQQQNSLSLLRPKVTNISSKHRMVGITLSNTMSPPQCCSWTQRGDQLECSSCPRTRRHVQGSTRIHTETSCFHSAVMVGIDPDYCPSFVFVNNFIAKSVRGLCSLPLKKLDSSRIASP